MDRAFATATRTTANLTDETKGKGTTSDPTAIGAEAYMLAKDRWESLAAELIQIQAALAELIPDLPSDLEKYVMTERYIQGKTVRYIAISTTYTETYIFRLLKQGEAHISGTEAESTETTTITMETTEEYLINRLRSIQQQRPDKVKIKTKKVGIIAELPADWITVRIPQKAAAITEDQMKTTMQRLETAKNNGGSKK